jgi:hypothetical protein
MLDGIRQFLNDYGPLISSIAAIVAIAVGVWKLVGLFSNKSEKSRSTTTTVKASRGGAAAGRDIKIDKRGPQNARPTVVDWPFKSLKVEAAHGSLPSGRDINLIRFTPEQV